MVKVAGISHTSVQRILAEAVAEITQKRVRRGTFASVGDLKDAVHDYLDRHNADPKPFVWTKTAEAILEKERRALNSLEAIKAGNQPSESEH